MARVRFLPLGPQQVRPEEPDQGVDRDDDGQPHARGCAGGEPAGGKPPKRWHGALTLLGGGEHEELPRGTHDVVLHVELPDDLRATFEAKKVKVRYEALIHLDIPAGRDFRHVVGFELASATVDVDPDAEPLSIRSPEDSRRGFFDSLFGPDVSMRLELKRTVVRRGGVLAGELEVRFPDKPPNIAAVVCKLLRREETEAHSHEDRHIETLVTECLPQRPGVSNSLFVSFEVRVPGDIIPSCAGAKFTLAHELSVSLEVPWAKDPTVRIPVTVV